MAQVTAIDDIAVTASAAVCPDVPGHWAKIKAKSTNTGKIGVGLDNTVTVDANGWTLWAGEETPWLPIANLKEFYIIGSSTSDDAHYIVLR